MNDSRPDHLIKFDAKKHEYKDEKGNKVMSVTKVLDCIPPDLRYKQVFIDKTMLGTRVHAHAETINKARMKGKDIIIVQNTYPEWAKDEPYVKAYRKFLKERDPEIVAVEQKLYHSGFSYAGTLDMVIVIRGKITIADIKCSAKISPTVPLQLSAYLEAHKRQPGGGATGRAVIHLKPNGGYSYIEFPYKTHKADFDIFLCKLKSKQWDLTNNPDSEF